jgi:hypothetical protein
MATDVQRPPEQSLNVLVGGIIGDIQTLMKQQWQLTRKEIQSDLVKARQAATMGAIGATLCMMGGLLLCAALALLLHWSLSPSQADPARIPLWGCFGLVGLLLAVGGSIVCFLSIQQAEKMSPLLEQSTQALEENLEWTTKATSNRS